MFEWANELNWWGGLGALTAIGISAHLMRRVEMKSESITSLQGKAAHSHSAIDQDGRKQTFHLGTVAHGKGCRSDGEKQTANENE